MAIERDVNVNVKGDSKSLESANRKAKKSIEDNLIKTIKLSEKNLAKFNKTSEKTGKILESNLANSTKIAEQQLKILSASSGLASQKIDQLSMSADKAGFANQKMESKIKSNISTIDSLIQILQFASKGISIMGSTFVAIVGKEKAFELINIAATRFSNTIGRLAKMVQNLGGPFAKLAPILFFMRDALRSNTAALSIFSIIGSESIETSNSMRESFIKNISSQLEFSNKMKLASFALSQYGKRLIETDGILNKLKGTTAIVAGATAGMIGTISEGLGAAGENVLLFAGSFAAVAGIDKIFNPVNNVLNSTIRSMIGAQNRAAMMSVQMGKSATTAQRMSQAFNQLKSNGLDVVSKGIIQFQDFLTISHSRMKAFNGTAKITASGVKSLSKAWFASSQHIELFEKGLAGITSRLATGAAAFTFLGTRMLSADGTMTKMAGVTLIALGIAMGGVVLIIKQLLAGIGGLIQSMGQGLTAATQKQIELFSKAEKNAFAFTQTISSYSKSTEEASVQTNMWNSFIKDTSEATGTTTDSLQALVAETIAATEAAGLNEQQMKQLISRTIDLSERAHKPAMDTLIALINGMNGASQSVIALGLHVNDSAVQHSKLNKEVKENFQTLSDAEKAQARYAVLMEQAGKASGFASNNADLLSKSVKIQENALKELHAELGRGAAIINSKYVFGLAEATRAFTGFLKPILPGIGLIEALGGKLLSVTGFLVKHALTIALVTSSYGALNVFLDRSASEGVFAKSLPFLNKSLNDVAKNLGAISPEFGSIQKIGKTSLQILKQQAINTTKSLIGLEASAKLTGKAFGGQMVKGLKAAQVHLTNFSKKLISLLKSPIAIKLAIIAAVIYLVVKALKKIEERTKVFSKVWAKFTDQFAGSSSMFDPLLNVLKKIGSVLITVIGVAVKFIASALTQLIAVVLRSVSGFMLLSQVMSAVLPDAMVASQESIDSINKQIELMNKTAADFAKEGAKDIVEIFISSAEAADKVTLKMRDWTKEIELSSSAVQKMEEKAKKAFEAVKEFTPKINMAAFIKETDKFDSSLRGLKKKLEAQKLVLVDSGANDKSIKQVETRISETMEAIKGLQIRTEQEVRAAKIIEVEMELQSRKNKSFTVEQEIKQMRLDFANETRSDLINVETERLLAQRKLSTDSAREGATIKQAALIEANSIELQSFRSKLQLEKNLALDVETQKQLEIAKVRAQALSGTPAGQQAGEDVEVLQAKLKNDQLDQLRKNGHISETQHQQAITSMKLNQMQLRTDKEIALQTQRDEALGLTPAALEARLAIDEEKFQMELQRLIANKLTLFETEKQFQESIKEAELRNLETRSQTKENFIEQEIAQNERRGNNFAASLGKIKLAQQKHGQIMGALMGVQQTAEFKGAQSALSNLSNLRNSKSRGMFEAGKAAAISGAMINMYQSATAALAPPPIGAGPILGPIVATTAIASGLVNIQNIKSQKFSGGQADQGMDSIPKSLSGKSFILSAGERVVQPEANKKLTQFLDGKGGGSGSSTNLTINIGTIDSDERVEQVAQRVKQIIREDSERGEPIISSRGIVNG